MRSTIRSIANSLSHLCNSKRVLLLAATFAGISTVGFPLRAQQAPCGGSVSSSACDSAPPDAAQDVPLDTHQELPAYPMRVYRMSVDAHLGTSGFGSEATLPLTKKFHLRAGSDFFSYSTTVPRDGNTVNASLRLRSANLAVDYYPTHHAFRVSPLLVFANSNHLGTVVDLGLGHQITLNNVTYYSDPTNPLHGSATVDLRRVSPGVTVGFGRTIPRDRHHFSFPVQAGFYYAGDPTLKVQFGGGACSTSYTGPGGCMPVENNPDFQYNVTQFKVKYQLYVNDAKFFPVISTGVAFAF